MGYNNNNSYNPCDPCGNNNKVNAEIPESVIRLLRYLKDPVLYLHNLYGNFPDGGELGWFAYVVDENKFATWDVELKRWKYMTSDIEKAFAILAGSVNSICMIAESYKDNITGLNTLHTEKLASDFDVLIKKRDILFAELYNVPVDRALRSEDIKRMEAKYEAFNNAVKEFFGSYQLALNYKHDTSLNGFLLINSTVQSSTNLITSLYQNVEPTTALTTSYNQHIVAKNALNTTIINSVSDSELSASELTDIQIKYKIYNDTISAFISEYQSIQNKGLKDVKDWLTDTTNGLILFVSTIGSTTETVKAVYANVGGTATQKATLKTKYDIFIQTDSELTTLIINSLSDSKLSSTELANIITKYQKYNTDLFGFYSELKKLEESTKQNKLVAGTLVELIGNPNNTTTINVKSDPKKQNKLVALDDTIILENKEDGTTGIRAVLTESIQIDNVGGTKSLKVNSKIVSISSSSQINYIGFESELNVIRFINDSDLQVIFSFNNTSLGSNKILKDYVTDNLILNKSGSVEFFKTNSGWRIIGLFGVSYFPDLSDKDRDNDYAMIVNANGTATIERIGLIEIVDESITEAISALSLNELYGDKPTGFNLVCPTIGITYKKVNQLGSWRKIAMDVVS